MIMLLNVSSKTDPALCPKGCGVSFREKKTIELLNVSSKNYPALCPKVCNVSFRDVISNHQQNMKKHIIYSFDVSQKFQCELCQKQ